MLYLYIEGGVFKELKENRKILEKNCDFFKFIEYIGLIKLIFRFLIRFLSG